MSIRHLAVLASLVTISVGCTPETKSDNSKTGQSVSDAPPPTVDQHAHPSEGPHHGTLVELGNEEYHAEVVHDAASVTVYILDSGAQKPVAIDAADVTINLMHDNKAEQFKLTAQADAGDAAGKSSRFVLADAELAGHIDDKASAPKLSVSINGTPFKGDIKHDNDHSGHDHAH